MTVLKQYNTGTSAWDTIVVGQPGAPGITTGSVAPANTSVLWMDTADAGSQVAVPAGGSAGQILAKTTGTDYATGWVDNTANQNYVINGAMEIWQRGTSHTITTSAFYTADRWYASGSGGATSCTLSKQTSGSPIGIGSHARMTYNTNSAFCNVFQALESAEVARLAGKTVTISFKARRNASYVNGINFTIATGTVADSLTSGTFTEIASVSISNSELPTGTSSNDWVTKSATVTIPSTAIALRLRIGEDSTQSAGAYIEYTGFKVEDGTTATPFKRAGVTLQAELAACQRYYWRFNWEGTGYDYLPGAIANLTTQAYLVIRHPVTMRTYPLSIDYSGINLHDSVNSYSASSLSMTNPKPDSTLLLANVASGLVQYRPYFMFIGPSGYIGFSAEL